MFQKVKMGGNNEYTGGDFMSDGMRFILDKLQ